MIDLRLGQMEPTDIRGIPFYNKDTGKMDWAEPSGSAHRRICQTVSCCGLVLGRDEQAAPSVRPRPIS
jgi:hypothetical protein